MARFAPVRRTVMSCLSRSSSSVAAASSRGGSSGLLPRCYSSLRVSDIDAMRIGGRFSGCRLLSSLPSHEVVGLPALSPTMEVGTIAEWKIEEGKGFEAGDVFCSVETDKALVDFEAQDGGVLGKILVAAGTPDVKVGTPIMVLVEDEESASAFKDFQVEPSAVEAAAEPAPAAPTPVPASAPPAAPKPAAKVVAPTSPSPPAAPVAAVAPPTPAPKSGDNGVSIRWGDGVKDSRLYARLAKEQAAYVKKYGSTYTEA